MRAVTTLVSTALLMVASNLHAETSAKSCPIYDIREFIVYYPVDSVEPFPESAPVADAFADFVTSTATSKDPCWKLYSPERVIVIGHTDTFGDADANIRLFKARAEAMAAHLKELGVNVPIEVQWRGESEPALNTGDDVREVFNSRVELGYK